MKPSSIALALTALFAIVLMSSVRAQGPDPGTVFPMHHREPAWSRQGLVAYEDRGIICVDSSFGGWREDAKLRGLWVLNPETGERRRVLSWGWTPSWSSDGQKLAFGYGGSIFTLDLETEVVTRLTSSGWNLFPSWSPDGEWIAYFSDDARCWLMRPDGSTKHVVADECGSPSWSADSRRILHFRWGGLFSMDVDGRNSERIYEIPIEDQAWMTPQYSPDGEHIAVSVQLLSGSKGGLPEVWVLNSDGTGLRRLTRQGGSHPSWSPDGRAIIFTRADYLNLPGSGVLWSVDPVTGVQQQVTSKWPESCPTPVAESSWGDIKRRFR